MISNILTICENIFFISRICPWWLNNTSSAITPRSSTVVMHFILLIALFHLTIIMTILFIDLVTTHGSKSHTAVEQTILLDIFGWLEQLLGIRVFLSSAFMD